jgi:XRE family transcriptional regulator, regulator of sulfur utilization
MKGVLMKNESTYLAENMLYLRQNKSWGQAALAKASGVARTTITHMESGEANPSLDKLVKVARALGVGIDEILAKPHKECLHVKACNVPVKEKKSGHAKLHKILPDPIRGMEIDKLCLPREGYMVGTPHIVGTREYFYCTKGMIAIVTQGEKFLLQKGDVLAFPGDARHVYKNAAQSVAEGFSVVVP